MTSHLKQQTFFSYIGGGGGRSRIFFQRDCGGGGRQIVCSPHENVTASPPSPRLVINDSSLTEMWNKQIIVPDKYDTFSNCA